MLLNSSIIFYCTERLIRERREKIWTDWVNGQMQKTMIFYYVEKEDGNAKHFNVKLLLKDQKESGYHIYTFINNSLFFTKR